MIDDERLLAKLLDAIPVSLREASGTAFYTGLASWSAPSPVYLMGINPGGDPAEIPSTVISNANGLLSVDRNYSAYRDERWGNGRGGEYDQGEHPMQKSVLHLFERLGFDAGLVPASNMVYARSRQEHHVNRGRMSTWAEECWPFHAEMIERLGVRVVICMGSTTSKFVQRKVGSYELVDTFTEQNNRRNKSHVYVGGSVTVVAAAHPSRSCWYTDACDLSPMVRRAVYGQEA